jgi:hypothetical protein
MFQVPDNLVSSTTAVMTATFSTLSGWIYLIGGVLLAVVVIEILVGAIRK